MHQRKTLDIDVGYLPERPKSVMPSPSPKKIKDFELNRPSSVLSNLNSPSKNVKYNELNNKPLGVKPEYCGDYQILRRIGIGSFGKVYKVSDINGKVFALKKIPLKQNMSRYDASCIITEIKIGAANKCKYLLSIKDVFIKNNDICLITDYARRGDLSNYIKSRKYKNRPLEEGLIWSILLQMLVGIEYLHHFNIIHRDIKSLNIFLTSEKQVLMGDFGISKILKLNSIGTKTQIGTPLYASPEIVRNETYSNKVDVWALGCVLWEMMSMTHAFTSNNIHMLNKRILSGYCSSSIPIGRYSKELINLAKDMINTDVNRRPSIIKILEMEPVKRRLEVFDIERNNFDDYTIIRGLQTSIYPPMNVSGWDRVVSKLREILGMDKEDLFKNESKFNYDVILKYAPPTNARRNNSELDNFSRNNYNLNNNSNESNFRLPVLNNQNRNSYLSRESYVSRYNSNRSRVRLEPFNNNPAKLSTPPWAIHYK